jgi:hypothetical protein
MIKGFSDWLNEGKISDLVRFYTLDEWKKFPEEEEEESPEDEGLKKTNKVIMDAIDQKFKDSDVIVSILAVGGQGVGLRSNELKKIFEPYKREVIIDTEYDTGLAWEILVTWYPQVESLVFYQGGPSKIMATIDGYIKLFNERILDLDFIIKLQKKVNSPKLKELLHNRRGELHGRRYGV